MRRKRVRLGIWISIVLGAGASLSDVAAAAPIEFRQIADRALGAPCSRSVALVLAAAGSEDEQERVGGEGDVSIERAGSDPFAYGVALEIIAAHYHAGLAAYEAGEREAGAQMFAHGFAEVYSELEGLLRERGVTELGGRLNATVERAAAGAPNAEVRQAAEAVFAALTAAQRGAPPSQVEAQLVRTQVLVEMLDRAAAQYQSAMRASDLESYLDGFGFYASARASADGVLAWLTPRNADAAREIRTALELLARAYPSARRPADPSIDADALVVAASRAKLAVSAM